jgi:hypothetical protein
VASSLVSEPFGTRDGPVKAPFDARLPTTRGGETEMEAASKKFRTVFAIVATIVVGAAMIQTIAPASGEPARMPVGACPPHC